MANLSSEGKLFTSEGTIPTFNLMTSQGHRKIQVVQAEHFVGSLILHAETLFWHLLIQTLQNDNFLAQKFA